MKIQFFGAAETVTGSCFMVTTEQEKFLVDCGLFQGSKDLKERNYGDFAFNPAEVDFILLTHAHVDHCGLIPKAYKHGFAGKIYTTIATKELCGVVLPDSAHIQEMEVERKNRKLARSGAELLEPIYTVNDAKECLKRFIGQKYEEEIVITPNVTVRFEDAGHILGSAIIEVFIKEAGEEKKLVFTGDIGNINQPIIDDPTIIKQADVVVMESTYGNRYHIEAENKLETLARIVKTTQKKGGNLVIPSFAVERTQDLIFHLQVMMKEGVIDPVDIYIDSPMAVEATKVFLDNPEFFTDEVFCNISDAECREYFEGPHINYVTAVEGSIALNKIKGAIIISASGMADAGRIKHHLKHNLWRRESTVLFVGYQAQGTLGRRILEGEKKVRIHGEEIAVKADIFRIDGFSSHADQRALVEWVNNFEKKPSHLFLVHGEGEALSTLQRVIEQEAGIAAKIAEYQAEYEIEDGVAAKVKEPVTVKESLVMPELADSFRNIQEKIRDMANMPGKDVRKLQYLLAQLNEIERELNRAG